MVFYCFYMSPLGEMRIECSETALTGCWFSGQKYERDTVGTEYPDHPILLEAKKWLKAYYKGKIDTFSFDIRPEGSPFRQEVWKILQKIPYGNTMTYSDIANIICKQSGRGRMSAQAVGGAVGHNPISVFIPCHRVIGRNGELTGYAGGIERKKALLESEGIKVKYSEKEKQNIA